MIKEIKELRVEIDGLAQLTKNLEEEITVVDLSDIPNNQSVEEWLENYEKGLITKDSKNTFSKKSKEVVKAANSLYLAKAWLGKVLQELGNENPYGSGYKTKEDIKPTADVVDLSDYYVKPYEYEHLNHIEKVDWLRKEIEKINNKVKKQLHFVESERMLLLERVEQHLSEARFWLGFELQRIKEEE